MPTTLVPHALALIPAVPSQGRPSDYLGNPFVHLWGHSSTAVCVEQAFVYPSFELAHRYAGVLRARGCAAMPFAVPDRSPDGIFNASRCAGCGCTELFACPSRCAWARPGMCTECTKPKPVEAWAVFRRPLDYPNHYVARRFVGDIPAQDVLTSRTLRGLRRMLSSGRAVITRSQGDDEAYVEMWL